MCQNSATEDKQNGKRMYVLVHLDKRFCAHYITTTTRRSKISERMFTKTTKLTTNQTQLCLVMVLLV